MRRADDGSDTPDPHDEPREPFPPVPTDWWYPTSTGSTAKVESTVGGAPTGREMSSQRSRWWRSDEAALRRQPGQRWGLGAAAVVLAVNLFGFVIGAFLVEDPASPAILLAIILPTFSAALVAVLITFARGNGPVVDFGLPTKMREFTRQCATGLAFGGGAVVGGIILAFLLFLVVDDVPSSVLEETGSMPVSVRIALVMWVWIGAPIAEEVIFRGILWGALERYRFVRRRVGILVALSSNWSVLAVTTVVFALWHVEFWRLAILLFAGAMFGLARLYTGSVLSSTVAHIVNNTLPAFSVLFLPEVMP
ncbi:CPBP family intramembrane glutamic endopeptidase [Hoyosella subflava]|uniref:Predicted metal-dependent membrane protease n=1 Tax=Hoyosella subflava (strain DSM 45089 / JCM 17490 / NBRC 109087 / DQS3-9A1) TaxID=443218 RepID=F6EIV2_HOYSD|nr:type II CAAX endopeptidase family protein [Hoyosella subflava]AEF40013.1 Predicted metal-dependent membrane protease [Hoyosella subflava DQS3-9A1]